MAAAPHCGGPAAAAAAAAAAAGAPPPPAAAAAQVVVVGSCNVDLIAYTERFPAPGETLFGSSFAKGFGGKGANQAVMAARLHSSSSSRGGGGGGVAMVAAVGDDSFGAEYRAALAAEGVDTRGVKVVAGVATGVAPIWVNAAGENCIIVVPGANNALTADDVAAAAPTLAASRVVLTQLEVPAATTTAALVAAHAAGATTILTPAPVPRAPLDASVWAATDILVPNRSEALALAGVDHAAAAAAAAPTYDVLAAAARTLLARGVGAVVITLGGDGVLVVAASAPHDCAHVAAAAVRAVVDTTGAGDAFSGALAHFLAAGGGGRGGSRDDLLLAVRRAAVVAGDSVTKKGTQASYAHRSDLPAPLFTDAAWHGLPAVTYLKV